MQGVNKGWLLHVSMIYTHNYSNTWLTIVAWLITTIILQHRIPSTMDSTPLVHLKSLEQLDHPWVSLPRYNYMHKQKTSDSIILLVQSICDK